MSAILAMDVFTKYPDYDLPASLDSYHSTCFVHCEIVCRYGVPQMLRVDIGPEFKGELVRYCHCMGIRLCPIATQNPRANGMLERLVATFKAGVHKCMSSAPNGRWWEAFPDIVRGFRQLFSCGTGLSPFLLQFKQFLELAPDQGLLQDIEDNTDWDQLAGDIDDTLAYWQHIFEEVEERLLQNDRRMIIEHA